MLSAQQVIRRAIEATDSTGIFPTIFKCQGQNCELNWFLVICVGLRALLVIRDSIKSFNVILIL